MTLTMTKCKKEGLERYHDFKLKWTYEGKEYSVKVKPVFPSEYKFFIAAAQEESEQDQTK